MEFSVGAAVAGAIFGIIVTKFSKKLGAIIALVGFLPLFITLLSSAITMSNSDPATANQVATNTTEKLASQSAGMMFDEMIALVVGAFVAAGLAVFAAIKHMFR